MKKFRLARNIFWTEIDESTIGMYNPIEGHNIVYLNKHLFFKLKSKQYISKIPSKLEILVKKHFLIPKDYDESFFLKKYRKANEVEIHLMYLLVTQVCNLKCTYCFEELHKRKIGIMSQKIADKAIDYFFEISVPPRKVIFYGGEPLINKEVVINSIKKIRKKDKKTNISIVTNGTLIDRSIAKFFKENNVNVSVSLDGPEEYHNIYRKYKNNKGSFRKTFKGYLILKNEGVNVSISCTIGNHNVDKLREISKFFAELSPTGGVGFNFLISQENGKNFSYCSVEKAANALFEAFEVLKAHGVYEDRVMRRLEPLTNNKVYLKECAGYGNQIVVRYDGKVGPCHAFSFFGMFFEKDIESDVIYDGTFSLWARRTPLNLEKCRYCPFVTLCGGGCAYDAYIKYGDLFKIDENVCKFMKKFFKWVLKEIWKKKSKQ